MRLKYKYFAFLITTFFSINLISQEYAESPPIPLNTEFFDFKSKPIPKRAYRSKKNGRFGFHGSRFIYIPFIYDELPKKYSDYMIAKKGDKFGMINRKGEEVLPFEYDKLFETYKDYKSQTRSGRLFAKKGDYEGILSKQGKEVIPIIYKSVIDIKEGFYAVSKKEGKHGIVHINGKTVAPIIYEKELNYAIGEYRITKLNSKYGCLKRNGEILIPFEYDNIKRSLYKNYIELHQNGKRGFINQKGKVLLPIQYDNIRQRPDGLIEATKDGKMGVLNSLFEVIISFKYHRIERKSGLYYESQLEEYGKFGVFDTLGTTILPIEFSRIRFSKNEFIFAQKGAEKSAVFNKKGDQIIPPSFHSIRFDRNYIIVNKVKNGKKALLDDTCKQLTDFLYDEIYIRRNKTDRDKFDIYVENNGQEKILNLETKEEEIIFQEPNKYEIDHKSIFSHLKGEWYGLEYIHGETYLHKYKFRENNSTERIIYSLKEKYKECLVAQEIQPMIIGDGASKGHYRIIFRYDKFYFFVTCEDRAKAPFQEEDPYYFSQSYLPIHKIPIAPLPFGDPWDWDFKDHVRKQKHYGDDNWEELKRIKRILEVQKILNGSINNRPGGFRKPKFNIALKNNEVTIKDGSQKFKIGTITTTENDYVFSTKFWEKSGHFSLAGVLKNVKYIDEKGEKKIGDLDICFKAELDQEIWFKELKK